MSIKIQVTEGKSFGQLRPESMGHVVRVFVDEDLHYGTFAPENRLFELLTEKQQRDYLAAVSDFSTRVSRAVAQEIIDIGHTPFPKQVLRPAEMRN